MSRRDIINAKSALSVFVVALMLTTCLCAVVGTSDAASESKPIVRNDTVVLDIDKDFSANKEQLAKLGITDHKGWAYSNEEQCYVLTLDNVHFVTTANVAIALYCENTHETESETIIIKLVGENTIVSGSEYVFEQPSFEGYCAGILAASANENKTVDLVFEGDGKLTVSNNITSNSVIGTSAIVADGIVAITEDAVVLANGGDFTHYLDGATEASGEVRFFSYGVHAKNVFVGSALIAVGGNVDVIIPHNITFQDGYLMYIISDGIYADKYAFIDAFVSGVGGEVYFGVAGDLTSVPSIKAHSSGIAINEDNTTTEYDTFIKDSKVIGASSWVKGITMADSTGIELGAATNGKVMIENSIVTGNADTAECATYSTSTRTSESVGIVFYGQSYITDSLVQGASGELAMGGTGMFIRSNLLAGIIAVNTMTVKNSIINASGNGLNDVTQNLSFGLIISDMESSETKKDFNVIDSEIYVSGKYVAVHAHAVNASSSPRAIYKLDSGTPETITLADITDDTKMIESVEILYAYDLIVESTLTGITGFFRITSNACLVTDYQGYVPQGMEFAGYCMYNGNGELVDVAVGDILPLDSVKPTFLYATFEVAEEDNGNPAVAWAIVIIALVLVALLAVGVYVWKSRN